MIVVTRAARKAMLAAMVGVGGLLNGCLLKLYKTNVGTSDEIALASLVEADFDGYAASDAIVWGAVGVDSQVRAVVQGDRKEFVPDGVVVTNTVYGAYITNAAGTALMAILPFDAPVHVTGLDTIVSVVPVMALPWEEPEVAE